MRVRQPNPILSPLVVNFSGVGDTYYHVLETRRDFKLPAWINNCWLLIGSLMAFALVLNREGDRFPTGNEFVYLLYFFKAYHPAYLAGDWTFKEPTAGHAIFNYALGWLTLLMPLRAATWLGRVVCWLAGYFGLFRVGRHFRIPPWAVWVGILLWLLQRQSPVTGEWMIGSFEAKVIAYPCLLFAIDAALRDRVLLAGILSGIAFSFHSAVGMWGGAALGRCGAAAPANSQNGLVLCHRRAVFTAGVDHLVEPDLRAACNLACRGEVPHDHRTAGLF